MAQPIKKVPKKTIKKKSRPIKKQVRPKARYRIRKQAVIPFVILILLLIYLTFSIFNFLFASDRNQMKVCGFSKADTLTAMNNRYEEIYTLSDYLYYGETLNVYESDYGSVEQDGIIGKKVQLKNLCDEQSYEFIIHNEIDMQIKLTDVKPGFYAVFIIDENDVKKRAVFDEVLTENAFTTITRNEMVKEVTLTSDPSILNHDDYVLDKNYLFMNVEERKPDKEQIDVLIDPYGKSKDTVDGQTDEGQVYHNVAEAQESYKAAKLLKTALEEYGLKVEIAKDRGDEITYVYGEESRLKPGYDKKAKYYIKLGLNGSPYDNAKGMEITHSIHSSSTTATLLMNSLLESTSLTPSTMNIIDERNPGIISSKLDGFESFDESYVLRETGGKATFAGTLNEVSALNTFASGNLYGMEGIEIDFLYLSNKEEMTYWKENIDEIMMETTNALVTIWNVTKE